MYRKQEDQRVQLRENVCGGHGQAKVLHIFEPDELENHVRLFNHMTLEPGTLMGVHTHWNEGEIYYVLEGEVVTGSSLDQEIILKPGDSSFAGHGDPHYIWNKTDKPAKVLAIIVGMGTVTLDK